MEPPDLNEMIQREYEETTQENGQEIYRSLVQRVGSFICDEHAEKVADPLNCNVKSKTEHNEAHDVDPVKEPFNGEKFEINDDYDRGEADHAEHPHI